MALEKMKRKVGSRLLRVINRARFEDDFLRYLPYELTSAARLIYYRNGTSEEKEIGKNLEVFRASLRDNGAKTIISYPSPHTGEFALDKGGHSVPADRIESRLSDAANTGVSPIGGILLRRIVTGLNAERVLELGTNTGFSAYYILSAETAPCLVTVEGSRDLCAIAERNISRISSKCEVLNMLFDEAIDQLLAERDRKFDLIFIDGQHERGALLHYTERCMPLLSSKGGFIYDDIYWSDGMNQAWKDVVSDLRFGFTVDFQEKGVALKATDVETKRHFDICDYIGRPSIFRKNW